MFGLFKKDPVKKLEKEYYNLLEKGRDVQRSGDLKEYARLVERAEQMWNEIEKLRADHAK